MCKTNDKNRFTFRIPNDIDDYLNNKSIEWRTSKSATLVRIILEYAEEHNERIDVI